MIEVQLLNAVVEKRDMNALVRHGLNSEKHFRSYGYAYKFIHKHMKEFGEMPSIESVVEHCERVRAKEKELPEFEKVDVTESIDTICLKLIEHNLKMDERKMLEELAKNFGQMDAYKILETLKERVEDFQERATARGKIGVNWAQSGKERAEEYEARKRKDFSKKIPCFFGEITEAVGGYERGEYVTIMGFTGKGKSWLGLLQALVANNAGFKVLIESAEMSKPENSFRLDTLEGKFSNRGLWTGTLHDLQEEAYRRYLGDFEKGTGRADLVIKTAEEWANGLTLSQLEADIDRTKCDMVVVDQFNLLKHDGTKRNDMSATSRALKQLAAKKGVVIVLLYQTNGDYEKGTSKGEDGVRELKLPTLKDYSETIAVIQDSNKLFSFDSVSWKDAETGRQRGKALVGIAKSRTGGENLELELEWCPNDGVIQPRQATDIF